MSLFRQSLLISLMLVLGTGGVLASEQHDFDVAATAFNTAMWSRAEVGFAQFIEKHPQSERVPRAALLQAQADFNQGKLQEAQTVLRARESSAGVLADQYVYWIANAQLQNADYSGAADSFARLTRIFPESQLALDGVVNEAAARARLNQWPRVTTLLQSGIFQDAAKTNATDSRVLNGRLLLAESLLAEHHPDSATAVLQSRTSFRNNRELDWRRMYLLFRARLAAGETNEALSLSPDLIANAGRAELRAQAVADQASLLENLGRFSDALDVYRENLTNNAPAAWQVQAILKIADLYAAQTNFSDAEYSLENFLTRFGNSPEANSALLALGELHLKTYVGAPVNSAELREAQSCFDQFVNTWTNSPSIGKAFLDRGWCFWIQGKWALSEADFAAAVERLPASVDLAVAHFKLGDAQFRLHEWAGARTNYQAVVNDFTNYPAVSRDLGAQALYQTLRVCLDLKDVPGMSNAMAQILKIYPLNNVAEKGILLVGEGLSSGLGQPEQARALFQRFEQVFPNSEQLPEVEWAVARTYEQESNWVQAISNYDTWIGRFSGNTNMAAVKYARAWANYQGGRETNAFLLFTNFLAEYPSNTMTPIAEWWLGDYYSGRQDWQNAEYYYQLVFQFTPPSSLTDPAILMAGRAAMGRQAYEQAKDYFEMLMAESNCPPQLPMQTWLALGAQAWFAYGDVMMQEPATDPNTPLTNYLQAIRYFEYDCTEYPGSEQAALAWGEIGDCYFQLAAQTPQYYSDATNAYAQVIGSPAAQITERSQAQVGIGLVCEKLADSASVAAQKSGLLHAALDNYLDVFFGNNLRNGETADPFWVKKAGLQALPLIESLGTGDPDKFIDQMEIVLPQLRDFLEKKRLEVPRPKESRVHSPQSEVLNRLKPLTGDSGLATAD